MRKPLLYTAGFGENKQTICCAIFRLDVLCVWFQCFFYVSIRIISTIAQSIPFGAFHFFKFFIIFITCARITKITLLSCYHRFVSSVDYSFKLPTPTQKHIAKNGPSFFRILVCILTIYTTKLTTCEAVRLTQARAITLNDIKQEYQPNGVGAPHVIMPPLDLGFRGQTSSRQFGGHDTTKDFQSDQASSKRWDTQQRDRNFVDANPTMRFTGDGPNQRKTPREFVDYVQPYYGPPYYRRYNAYDVPPSNTPPISFQNPKYYYPTYARSADYIRTNDLESAQYPQYPYSNNVNTWQMVPRNAQSKPIYKQPSITDQIHHQPEYRNEPTWRQPSYSEEFQVQESRSVGHASNYGQITEEEIQKRIEQYHQENGLNVQLPALPQLGKENEKNDERSKQDHLVMNGNLAHDQLAQRFQRVAGNARVEDLFDEIDTNHDGVIRLEELRNFMWLHEMVPPP